MTRALLCLGLATTLSGCGVMLDGVYLISDKRFTKEERQAQPTEHTQAAFEHTVRAEQGQVWLACEDTERVIERAWMVRKEYEHVGGMHQAHWLPLILDTIIGGALGIGFGIECAKTGASPQCLPLIAVAPLAVDAIYSAVRLAMIEPPKLVHKERQALPAAPSATPTRRQTVACEPDAVILVGRSAADPLAAWFRVDAWGAMAAEDRPRLLAALQQPQAQLFWAAGGRAPATAAVSRCEALAALGGRCPQSTAR